MKVEVLQIIWHNQQPIYSIDFHSLTTTPPYRFATSGADSTAKIWRINADNKVEFLSNITRHLKAVNCVRFSPNGEFLGSVSDDGYFMLWKKEDNSAPEVSLLDPNADENIEKWSLKKGIQAHPKDVYCFDWSPSSNEIITGSTNNTTAVWNIAGQQIQQFVDHLNFVQGVSWDPLGKFIVSQSSDRTCRVYQHSKQKRKDKLNFFCSHVLKFRDFDNPNPNPNPNPSIESPNPNLNSLSNIQNISQEISQNNSEIDNNNNIIKDEKKSDNNKEIASRHGLFLGDTLNSFFRRCGWSPDGSILITPSGIFKSTPNSPPSADLFTSYVWSRSSFVKPMTHLPSKKASVGVRFCPLRFELINTAAEIKGAWLSLPYRMIFVILLSDEVLIYDTQHYHAIARITSLHYAPLTDASWTPDGRKVIITSLDGFCSVISFDEGELGVPVSSQPLVDDKQNNIIDNNVINVNVDVQPVKGEDNNNNNNNNDQMDLS